MGPDAAARRVVVLADDLIWSTRLAGLLHDVGAEPVVVHGTTAFEAGLSNAAGAIVDLTARSYDPPAVVRRAARAGLRVLCVGEHDDVTGRRDALAAGADRVIPFRKMAADGAAVLRAWLDATALRPSVGEGGRAVPHIPPARYAERLARSRALLAERAVSALLGAVGPDLVYLTGHDATPLERLTLLVVPVEGPATLVVPRLELTPARTSPAAAAGLVELAAWEETDDPHELVARLAGEGGSAGRIAVSDRLWSAHLLRLQAALPGATWLSGSSIVGRLRIVKDGDEIELLRLAAAAADRVVDAISAGPLVGRSEADVSREVRERLVAEGHSSADFAIVASGPNSASPHHGASDRVIRPGEPIVLDIGGIFGGYASDTTRTLWVTGGDPSHGPDDGYLALYALLQAAQAEATHAVRPGVPAERIDAVAREIIAAGGHGHRFIHRTGHGIGLETHEDPYLVAGDAEPLREGMAFSVEPGIYVEGLYGARIEDIVVCGPDGPDVLNGSSRHLRIVDGT